MNQTVRVQVLMPLGDADRFEAFCVDRGHKKSTLIARLIREHLAREGYGPLHAAGQSSDRAASL